MLQRRRRLWTPSLREPWGDWASLNVLSSVTFYLCSSWPWSTFYLVLKVESSIHLWLAYGTLFVWLKIKKTKGVRKVAWLQNCIRSSDNLLRKFLGVCIKWKQFAIFYFYSCELFPEGLECLSLSSTSGLFLMKMLSSLFSIINTWLLIWK